MSKLYAVALALLVLAVPAMARPTDIDGPWEENVTVNVAVAEMVELWHDANATVNLGVYDAAKTFGRINDIHYFGNRDFDVYVGIAAENNSLPANVLFELVVNVPQATRDKFTQYNTDGLLAALDPALYECANHFAVCNGGVFATKNYPESLAPTKVLEFRSPEDGDQAVTKSNLYSVYAGHGMPLQPTGSVLVEYTIVPVD